MSPSVIFITHAEVVIDPAVPVPDWPLTPDGAARHRRFATNPALGKATALFCSDERKARDGAEEMAPSLGLSPRVRAGLGENDRSSTGFLVKTEFEATADRFFAQPDHSIRGWETARDAQARIISAVKDAVAEERAPGDVVIVGHGGTAALLRCALLGREITRDEDQTEGGGCWYQFPADFSGAPSDWQRI